MVKPKFKEKIKIKCLLWCDRHCCLCKKNCGTDIELAHINQKLNKKDINKIDNAMPLCYDCHAKIGHYNTEHPRGNKYTESELKTRREQIYEEFTRHLIPLMDFQITQTLIGGGLREFPDVGFEIRHLENRLPVKVLTLVDIYQGNKKVYNPGGHYAKEKAWKINPGLRTQGHFTIPENIVKKNGRISAIVNVEIIDEYERSHPLLPIEWVYETDKPRQGWWYNP
jgi:hypothetical protein